MLQKDFKIYKAKTETTIMKKKNRQLWVDYFNFLNTYKTSREKTNTFIENLNNSTNQLVTVDIYRTIYPKSSNT